MQRKHHDPHLPTRCAPHADAATTRAASETVKPAELLAQTLRALALRTSLDTARVSDAIFGCVTQTGDQGTSVGTIALPLAQWSDGVSAVTINGSCASGLSAIHFAALQALHGDTLAVGGGIEMMSRVPMGSDLGPLTHDRELQVQARLVPIGIAADAIATRRGYSRAKSTHLRSRPSNAPLPHRHAAPHRR